MSHVIHNQDLKKLIQEVLTLFTEYSNPKNSVEMSKLEHHFSKDIKFTLNGDSALNGIQPLQLCLKDLQKKIKSAQYSLKDVFSFEDKAAIRYLIQAQDSQGKKHDLWCMAMIQWRDSKITSWIEVFHEQGIKGHLFNK